MTEATPYLEAVRTYADRVLEHARDRYSREETPLLADGLDVETLEPARWTDPEGETHILANPAAQQNFFRTLAGLSALVGAPAYRTAAVRLLRWVFDRLTSPNGLIYWGGHIGYSLTAGRVVFHNRYHELKAHYPFYLLMHDVDPPATERYIAAFWHAHILDWSTLRFNRHGDPQQAFENPWEAEYVGGEVFFTGHGLTFLNTGSDLVYAAVMQHRFTNDERPLVWARRLAGRYVEARNPETGLGGYQFSRVHKDRAERQFGPELPGHLVLEATVLPEYKAETRFGKFAIVQLKLSRLLGKPGRDFRTWALEDLAAFGRRCYTPETNRIQPMLTDGTPLTPEMLVREDYYSGRSFAPYPPSGFLLWSYALGAGESQDPFLWETCRAMVRGNGLGDIGRTFSSPPDPNLETDCADAKSLLAMLALHEATGREAFLALARRIGANILRERVRNGFFIEAAGRRFAHWGQLDPLALLRLAATLEGKQDDVPDAWPGESQSHGPYREMRLEERA